MDSLRERNDIIFDVCVDRMHAGAAMGIFPKATTIVPSLRPSKADGRNARPVGPTHSELTNIEVVPVGLDYEHFVEWDGGFG